MQLQVKCVCVKRATERERENKKTPGMLKLAADVQQLTEQEQSEWVAIGVEVGAGVRAEATIIATG